MNDQILNIILKDTYTLSSLKHRVRILKSHLNKKFFGEAEKEPLEDSDAKWLDSLPPQFFEKFTKDNALSEISELDGKINQIKPLTLYLAFEVNEQVSLAIGLRVRELFQPDVLLDIKLNPALLAGCALVWKGIYKDYSLKAMIEARKTEILESFKKFLR